MFAAKEIFPGVYHAADCMGVYVTLLVGRERALLVDTGFGLQDVRAWARSVTELPLTVLLTHAHHDHALGARWFDEVHMFPEDLPYWQDYTSPARRERVAATARDNGVAVPEDFLTAAYPAPVPAREETLDLGGLHARIALCPGHTPGSAMVLVEEYGLLLSGDNWNPCTWLFFPEAVPVHTYLKGMRRFFAENGFSHVLCPHREGLYPRELPERFLAGLTDERLEQAYPVPLWDGPGIEPCRCDVGAEGEELYLVFDRRKLWK